MINRFYSNTADVHFFRTSNSNSDCYGTINKLFDTRVKMNYSCIVRNCNLTMITKLLPHFVGINRTVFSSDCLVPSVVLFVELNFKIIFQNEL